MTVHRTPDVGELLELAVRLVREAAEVVQAGRVRAVTEVESKSTPTDAVTAMDRVAERLVVAGIASARPGDAILGEEGGERAGDTVASAAGGATAPPVRWILDPIDGTVNYIYGIPQYAVSLAAEVGGVAVVGVVRNAATGEEWTAVRGQGAWRDGRRLRGPSGPGVEELAAALVGTGFGYDAEQRRRQAAVLATLLPEIRDIRRGGSAALDLCHLAEGRLDGYYEQGLKPWDRAAGELIATEAGLCVTGLEGEPAGAAMTLAAPPALHRQLHDRLVTLIRPHDR